MIAVARRYVFNSLSHEWERGRGEGCGRGRMKLIAVILTLNEARHLPLYIKPALLQEVIARIMAEFSGG